jgi:hypothetical protein
MKRQRDDEKEENFFIQEDVQVRALLVARAMKLDVNTLFSKLLDSINTPTIAQVIEISKTVPESKQVIVELMKWDDEKYDSFVKENENKEPALSLDALQGEIDANNYFFNEDRISMNFSAPKTKKKKLENTEGDEDEDNEDEDEEDLDNGPAEFVLSYTGDKLEKIVTQIKQMIKAGVLPQYLNMTANEDNSVFLLRNKEDLGTYANNKDIIEAIFIKSTHIDFETSSESGDEEQL